MKRQQKNDAILREAFYWIINIFEKHSIQFQLTGGFAARIYGSLRELRDIDFDVPNLDIYKIVDETKEYTVFGPQRFKDDFFDVLLLRIDYKGQIIDIGGGTDIKNYDKQRNLWIDDPTDFFSYEIKEVFGKEIPVIKPEELIAYKKMSPRAEDLLDIEAINRYLKR